MAETGGKKKETAKKGSRKNTTTEKINNNLRTRISGFLDANFEEAMDSWKKIAEPVQKVRLYNDLIKFTVPSLQSVDLEANVNKLTPLEDKMRELDVEGFRESLEKKK